MHIGLNAYLLATRAGFRSAGIHSVIHHLLLHLPHVMPPDWRLTAHVGNGDYAPYDGVQLKRARWDTEAPLKRIVWEQFIEPWRLDDFDLYHAMAFVAPLLMTKPIIVTIYDLTFMRYPQRLSPLRRLYLQLFTALTCRRARRIIAISESTANDLVALLGIERHKIDVTPLGYNAQLYRPLPTAEIADFRRRQGLPDRFWLFIGTLEPRKNLGTLLRAYARLPRSERLPLVLAGGKGWQYEEIFNLVDDYHLQDSVRFPGFLPTDSLALWYNSAEVFLYPSVFEGFGLPVLEAMACGVPVVTSDISSLPEVAGSAGLCIPPHDETAWAETLRRIYYDSDWRQQARQQGLKRAQQFDWMTTARATLSAYQRAMSDIS